MSSLSLRRYRPADRERVRELHEEAMRDIGALVEGVPEPDLDDVTGTYLDGDGEFLVGEVDGQVVAMGAFRPPEWYVTEFLGELPDGTAEITRMRVDPDHQRRGYGQRLYEELERRAREADYTDLVLDTTPVQTGAQRLYEKMGFEEVLREPVEFEDESFVMIFYRKSLTAAE